MRCGRSGLCRRDATHWGTTRCGKSVFHQASFKQIWRVALTCLCLYCSAALLYSSLCCLMPLLTHRPGFLLRLVSATVSKSSEAAAIGSGHISMSRGHPLECNLCVCLPAYLSANLRRDPRKEILHQCRPDYRSERDQCQKAQSGVMRPNGETSRGLFNGNEYTM